MSLVEPVNLRQFFIIAAIVLSVSSIHVLFAGYES